MTLRRRPETIAPEDDGLVSMNGDLVQPEVLHLAAEQAMARLRADGNSQNARIKRYRHCYGGLPDATTPSFAEFIGRPR